MSAAKDAPTGAMDRTPIRDLEFLRTHTDPMSASFHSAYDETPTKKCLTSRSDTHRSYHTLPRKAHIEQQAHRAMIPHSLSSTSFNTLSNASIPNLTDEYTFTSDEHPNYTNMMNDNHLIDSCTEAQQDIREPIDWTLGASSECGNRMLGMRSRPSSVQSNVMSLKDTVFNAQKLQQWISYMQRYVEAVSPARPEVLRMTSFERKTRLQEQVDLRKYIASYDAMVKRFVKSATCASSHQAGINVKNLEEKYLMLLLQAIEAQCLLEGYPGMRNASSGCSKSDEDDAVGDGAPSAPLGSRIVEGKCSSPANAFSYYCLNETSPEDKYSVYSYDSVDGVRNRPANLRDEILDVIGVADVASSSSGESVVEKQLEKQQPAAEPNPERLSIVTVVAMDPTSQTTPTVWSKKKVNRWLHFQAPPKPLEQSSPMCQNEDSFLATSPMSVPISLNSPADSGRLSATSDSSYDPEQHWDHYQELYSTVNSSAVDLSAAEDLLHFGDNYSDLLRPPGDTSSLTASSVSLAEFFLDESNFQSLDDSFLLSGFKKSLPMSALKTIDDIFDFSELHVHAGTNAGALTWIEPSLSPRRSPSGTSCSKSTASFSSSSILRNSQVDADRDESASNYFSSMDTAQSFSWPLDDAEDTSRSLSMESLADDLNDMTIVPHPYSPSLDRAAILALPSKSLRRSIRKLTVSKRIFRRARRTKLPTTTAISKPSALLTVVQKNIAEMRPEDVQSILDTCRDHLECLNHVLLGQTVNTIVQQPAVNLGRCAVACEHCQCGPIARFVQSVVDFLLDYANCFRHFMLYKMFVQTIRQMVRMARTISAGVKRHRMLMGSIEFVL